jgi:hypothetical protein
MKKRMQASLFAATVSALVIGTLGGQPAAKGAPCQAISTVWALASTYSDGITGSRVYGDGLGAYTDGSSGVSAVINACSTNDAVLIPGNNRQLDFNLAGALVTGQPPAWTQNGSFASPPPRTKNCAGSPCTLLNIQNVLASGTVPRNQPYRIYTTMLSAFIAPDGKRYHLDMQNPTDANARVVVDHYPASGSVKESWVVYPETAGANASLFSDDRAVDYAQFSAPFYINISVK